jgi:hypothetical protein
VKKSIIGLILILAVALLIFPLASQTAPAAPRWVAVSNAYTNKLLAAEMKHRPESGSKKKRPSRRI